MKAMMPNTAWFFYSTNNALKDQSVLRKPTVVHTRHDIVVLWATARYPEVVANRARWPRWGCQPQNLNEHATWLTAKATALLALVRGKRPKLPDQRFGSFINSL